MAKSCAHKQRLWTGDFTLTLAIAFCAFVSCQALNNGTPLYIPTNVTDRASVDAMVARSGISAVWTASSTTRASTSRACSSTKGTSTNWTKRSGTRS